MTTRDVLVATLAALVACGGRSDTDSGAASEPPPTPLAPTTVCEVFEVQSGGCQDQNRLQNYTSGRFRMTTACSPYLIDESMDFPGLLEIEPGVELEVTAGATVTAGFVYACGAQAEPIRLRGWKDLPLSGASSLYYVNIEGTGDTAEGACAVVDRSAEQIELVGVTLQACDTGLELLGEPARIDGVVVQDAQTGVRMPPRLLPVLFDGLEVRDVARNVLAAGTLGTDGETVVWPAAPAPWHVEGVVSVDAATPLIVEAGLEATFAEGGGLRIASPGAHFEGTEDKPIRLTAADGPFEGVALVGEGATLSHVDLVDSAPSPDSASPRGCLHLLGESGEPALQSVTLDRCGVGLSSDGPVADVDGLAVRSTPVPLALALDAIPDLSTVDFDDAAEELWILPGPADRDTTLQSVGPAWRAMQDMSVSGRLTLEPGVELQLPAGSSLDVPGGLIALGTPSEPIRIAPSETRWGSIRVPEGGELRLDHVELQQGGASEPCVVVSHQADLDLLANTHFNDCLGGGLDATRGTSRLGGMTGLTFSRTRVPMRLSPARVDDVRDPQTYDDAAETNVVATNNSAWEDNPIWRPQGIPLRADYLSITAGTLSLAPGMHLQFAASKQLDVGTGGRMVAQGTPEAPIILESAETAPGPGAWSTIRVGFEPQALALDLQHTIIRHGGEASYPCLAAERGNTDHSLRLQHVTFEDCGNGGLSCSGRCSLDAVSDLTFRRMPMGMRVTQEDVGVIQQVFTYEDVDENVLFTQGWMSEDTTILDQGVPWRVDDEGAAVGTFTIGSGTLTLAEGLDLRMADKMVLRADAGARVVIAGTKARPVRMTPVTGATWRGLWLGETRDAHTIDWLEMDGSGSSIIQGKLLIRDSTFTGHADPAFDERCGGDITIERSTFTGTAIESASGC